MSHSNAELNLSDIIVCLLSKIETLQARVQELEASQAQREPMSDAEIREDLGIDGSDEWAYTEARAVEAAHGITAENRHAEQDFGMSQGQELL